MGKYVILGLILVLIFLAGCVKPNQPPVVEEVYASTTVSEKSSFDVSAKASDPDGSVEKVQFVFGSDTKDGVLDGDVYKATFTAPSVSSDRDITLTVTAYDDKGKASTPKTKTITVIANKAPNVDSLDAPSSVHGEESFTATARVSDPDGLEDLDKVVFTFEGKDAVVTSHTGGVFVVNLKAPAVEVNQTLPLSAQAYDKDGNASTPKTKYVSVLANNPPSVPSSPYPANGATGVPVNVTLSWSCSDPDGDTLTYDVYFGQTSTPPLVKSGHNLTSYSPGTLEYSTTYYWKIVAKDSGGKVTEGPVWHFTAQEFEPPASVYGFVLPYVGDVTTSIARKDKVLKARSREFNFPPSDYSQDRPVPEAVPHQFVVKVKTGIDIDRLKQDLQSKSCGANETSVKIKDALVAPDNSFAYILIESSSTLLELRRQLASFSWFENIEPNYIAKACEEVVPNDEYYPLQWHYVDIKLPSAWAETKGSIDVVIAVLDTGVRFHHPDLEGVFYSTGYDFIDNDNDPTDPGNPDNPSAQSHGTHVAGTIAALTGNSKGVAGVTWGKSGLSAKILPVRVLGSDGSGSYFQVSQGIIYAVEHGAKVINMSLGGAPGSSVLHDAVKYAHNNDVVIVCAAGNENGPVSYPAAYSETIAVGAVRWDWTRAYYSNYGPEIDVVAPGGDTSVDQNWDGYADGILSTTWSPELGDHYAFLQGTSMAAPHVTGVVALMMSVGISGVEEIRSTLRATAYDLGASGFDWEYGYGLVDAYKAVTAHEGWEPLMVFSVDPISREIDNVTTASEDGAYSLPVNMPNAEIYVWRDFDHDGEVSFGDLYGYYGYAGGDPLLGEPDSLTVAPGEEVCVDLLFAPLIDTSSCPTTLKGFEKVLTEKERAIDEHYDKREP